MKYIFLTISLFLATSCSVMLPHEAKVYSTDYSEFTSKGFFITESNSVNFEYTPLGSVTAYYRSGSKGKGGVQRGKGDPNSLRYVKSRVIHYTLKDALQGAYKEAVKMGGNGIINLKTNYVDIPNLPLNYGYVVTGMVIKR